MILFERFRRAHKNKLPVFYYLRAIAVESVFHVQVAGNVVEPLYLVVLCRARGVAGTRGQPGAAAEPAG